MAKYKNAIRDEADDMSYSQELAATQAENQPQEEVSTDSEDASFRKRYGDLRRHMQQTLAQKDQELTDIKRQLDSAAKGQIKPQGGGRVGRCGWMRGTKVVHGGNGG